MEERTVKKIAVIGAESTGKTELCEALAQHFNTLWVPEYARSYFNDSDIYNYSIQDLEKICEQQVAMEKALIKKANGILFCDTAIVTLKIWSDLEFGFCPETILRQMGQNHYDLYLITNNEVLWQKDEQRQNKFSRDLIFNMNVKAAEQSMQLYRIVTGLGEERILNAISFCHELRY